MKTPEVMAVIAYASPNIQSLIADDSLIGSNDATMRWIVPKRGEFVMRATYANVHSKSRTGVWRHVETRRMWRGYLYRDNRYCYRTGTFNDPYTAIQTLLNKSISK